MEKYSCHQAMKFQRSFDTLTSYQEEMFYICTAISATTPNLANRRHCNNASNFMILRSLFPTLFNIPTWTSHYYMCLGLEDIHASRTIVPTLLIFHHFEFSWKPLMMSMFHVYTVHQTVQEEMSSWTVWYMNMEHGHKFARPLKSFYKVDTPKKQCSAVIHKNVNKWFDKKSWNLAAILALASQAQPRSRPICWIESRDHAVEHNI